MPGANWELSLIRVVLFTQKALPLTTDLFSQFAGEPPDQQEDRPKEGIRRQSAPFDGGVLRTVLTPIMAELNFGPPLVTAEQLFGEFPLSTGDLKAELAKFEHRLLVWLPKWEIPTMRVSLVVQARAAASSSTEAYEILRDNLSSVSVRPGEMSDLIFRVNWKADTKAIEEGYFNRVSTWTAFDVRTAAGAAAAGAPEVELTARHFAQVDMDLNSPAERSEPLPQDQLGTIYSELFQLAVNIADQGEHS